MPPHDSTYLIVPSYRETQDFNPELQDLQIRAIGNRNLRRNNRENVSDYRLQV